MRAHGSLGEAILPDMRSRTLPAVLGTVFLGAACPLAVIAQQPEFGGPDSVRTTIADDDQPKESVFRSEALQQWLEPYYDFKSRLAEEHGVTFGLDYSAVYLAADNSAGKDRAASGMLRFFGGWDVIGRESGDTGTLVWKVENRHRYTDIPPSAFGPEHGYVGFGHLHLQRGKRRVDGQRRIGGREHPTGWCDVQSDAELQR